MKKIFKLCDYDNLHFIGAGGISMSGIMEYLIRRGLTVTGSDRVENEQTKRLRKLGAKIYIGHQEGNAYDASAVVVTSAVGEDNPELAYAREMGLRVYKRSQLLSVILSSYKTTVAVSGSHGKTTTTAMLAHILNSSAKRPTCFIGGVDRENGNCQVGNGQIAVFEACEYKKNFLDFNPTLAVVLNIDNDHLDSYGSMMALKDAFQSFIKGRVAFVNADDAYAKEISSMATITFGIDNSATYTAKGLRKNLSGYSFYFCKNSRQLGRIKLSVIGKHNVYNALASLAVGDYLGVSFKDMKRALENFVGVKRRMEYLGRIKGTLAYADYAHHPSEISATLSAFLSNDASDAVIFQPHTYSRTRILLDDFVSSLSGAKTLVIYKTYPARESFDRTGSAYTLYRVIKKNFQGKIYYAKDKRALKKILAEVSRSARRTLFLGAGDIYDLAKSLLDGGKN